MHVYIFCVLYVENVYKMIFTMQVGAEQQTVKKIRHMYDFD